MGFAISLIQALFKLQIKIWQVDVFEVIRLGCQPSLNALKIKGQELYTIIMYFSDLISVWQNNF